MAAWARARDPRRLLQVRVCIGCGGVMCVRVEGRGGYVCMECVCGDLGYVNVECG